MIYSLKPDPLDILKLVDQPAQGCSVLTRKGRDKRLYIQQRGTIQNVDILNMKGTSHDTHKTHNRDADWVGTVGISCSEDPMI